MTIRNYAIEQPRTLLIHSRNFNIYLILTILLLKFNFHLLADNFVCSRQRKVLSFIGRNEMNFARLDGLRHLGHKKADTREVRVY